MKLQVTILMLALLGSVATSMPNQGTCTAGIMVMTKEEMKTEIREQLMAIPSVSNCTCDFDRIVKTVRKIEMNLSIKMDSIVQMLGEVIANSVKNNSLSNFNTSQTSCQEIPHERNKSRTQNQLGLSYSYPAVSCKEIYDYDLNTPSGWYWIEASDGTTVRKFCQ